jgi:ABC-type multidrug transport system permease subunit
VTDVSSAETLRGLGGWLSLLVIGQVAGLLRLLKAAADDIAALGSRHVLAMGKSAIYFELALNLIMLMLIVTTTVMMFQKRRLFPTVWKLQATTNLILSLIGVIVIAVLLNMKLEDLGMSLAQLAFGLVWLLAWTSYLATSVRVKNTFVN